ncbi:MAG: choice-of-anchor J domain-containing protein, partial [Bacteroidales bacterium]|nr:choice-of-anchor J domain-containing protein [Bacteroidales bacterium]
GSAGVPGYVWMIRTYIANGAKGEVTEISVPQRPHAGGKLAAVKATRDDQTFDFEDGTMQGWTTIDADNDGFNWATSTAFGGHNASTGIVYSQSYDNNYGVLYPDNYLVSPAKGQYGSITFYACAQDNGYAAEHFGVAVSTGSNTSAADFTTVQEWTLSAKSVGAPTTATRSGNRTQGNWYEYTVDLSAYAGQDIWVALRHFNCFDMFYIDVDDITLSGEGSGPVPPVPPTPGESAVLGAAIFRNGDCIAEVMAPEMTYTDVNPGEAAEYEIRVIYDGEKFAADTLGGGYLGTYYAMSCPLSCYPGDMTCDAPENLAGEYVWDNGTFGAQISWTYGEAPSSDIDIDFEDASMGNWTTIDADNDGYNWMVGTAFGGHNGSTGIVYSQSYDNSVGALTPDNYFVSPQTPLGGSFSFWACAQDNAWAAEHFGVAVSTAGNTSASDFTTVQEWTMTAKSNGRPNSARGEREQGTWYQYTVDLSSYAGQMGYIAIRHFNSTDWFYLDVDDITYTLAKRAGDPVNFAVYRNGSQIATVPCTGAYSYTYFDNVAAGNYEYQVKALYEDCESDFALTATGQNYVTVNVTAVGEISDMISVYPNPTNGNVTIEAAGMNRITVVSALGQVVYDAAVNADNYQMNLGQFKAGIYMVRISTESGVSVKRVTVVE